MENDTKYPLIIIGVALLSLVAFNFDDLFTGGTILKNAPSTFPQERLVLSRSIDIPSSISAGSTINIIYVSTPNSDLIQINKEKILFYEVDGSFSRFKKQITYPRCNAGRASACFEAEKSYTIPISWEKGKYKVQIEREGKIGDKFVKEIVGRAFFDII